VGRGDRQEQPKARVYDSMEERDAALEARYSYDREGWPSTLSFVDAQKQTLAREFLDWRMGRATDDLHQDLRRWEDIRFGNALDPGPHGVLAFEVRWQMNPGARRYASLQAIAKATEAARAVRLPQVPTAKSIPPGHQTRREREEQLARLREQAAELGVTTEAPGQAAEIVEAKA